MKVDQLLEARALQKLPKATDLEFDKYFAMALFNHILEEIGQKGVVLSPQGMVLARVDAFAAIVKDAGVFDAIVAWIRKNSKIDRVFKHATGRPLEVHRFQTFFMAFDQPDEVLEQPDVIFVMRKRPMTSQSGYRIKLEDDEDSMMFVLLDRALKSGKEVEVNVTAADGFHTLRGTLYRTKPGAVAGKPAFRVVKNTYGGESERLRIDADADTRWELVPAASGALQLRDIKKKK